MNNCQFSLAKLSFSERLKFLFSVREKNYRIILTKSNITGSVGSDFLKESSIF